jgi:hypothetical protein
MADAHSCPLSAIPDTMAGRIACDFVGVVASGQTGAEADGH